MATAAPEGVRPGSTSPASRNGSGAGWAAAFALSVVLGHHVGTIFKRLGHVGPQTEWADWIDLLTPYTVIGTALACLVAARVDRRTWVLTAVASVVYVQGHGLHLSANSIGNARGDLQPVHLWDEVVGHYVWYGGLYLLVAALALALLPAPVRSPWRWPLAVLFGLTMVTNAIEGGTPVLTLVVSAGFVGWGLRHRAGSGWVLVTAFGVALAGLAGWGLYHQGFPQFSELGLL
ncbi:MAG: hypothetical protein JWO60_1649 [Frankiales bacterium]|jgi:hypothetical protein|nr:hypothetical protein [Frankiales bacterium]